MSDTETIAVAPADTGRQETFSLPAPTKVPKYRQPKTTTPKPKGPSAAKLRDACILIKHASDPTRLGVLLMLSDQDMNVGEICHHLAMSQPALSHHLALLRHGRIIESHRMGKHSFYALTDTGQALVTAVRTLVS